MSSVPDETTTPEEARKQQKQEEALHASNLHVPRHPLWTPNMSADELNASEMQAFLAWRRSLARWFAKRFLHPDIVSIYDYIFLWDEDLGVEHFSPSRYVEIIKREGLEISQPALDPNSTEIHHRITIRARTKKFHRFVEGMTPIFSQSAWYCTWHLIQNDLVHGWGVDMKLGYCAQHMKSISETIKSKTASISQINSDIEKRKHEASEAHQIEEECIKEQDELIPLEQSARQKVAELKSVLDSEKSQGSVLKAILKAKETKQIEGIYGRMEKQVDLLLKLKKNVSTPEGVPRLFDLVKVQDERMKLAFFAALRNTVVAKDLDQH
ncbi:Structural maintenance of chromosomes protein 4 [Glycine max]|nr:Structural maintenance of chromosomes protein 4 [Glycine max]